MKHLIGNNIDDESKISALTEREVAILEQIIDRLSIRCANNPTRREITTICHIHQVDTWDCGLACLYMVINWLHSNTWHATQEEQEEQRRWMMDFVKAKSLWTIDLVILLQQMLPLHVDSNSSTSCTYLFCSNRFGVDESYYNLHYYKDAFSADELRVKRLFDQAEQQSLPLMQVSHMSLNILIDIVSRENIVAIVLLDNTIYNQQSNLSTSKIHDQSDLSYSGHYIVLCGISTDKNDINTAKMNSQKDDDMEPCNYCLVVKNPGIWKETQFVTPSLFEKSWRAKGTDEDVILIAKHV